MGSLCNSAGSFLKTTRFTKQPVTGKNFLEVKDASGKEFSKEMVAAAKSPKSNGWVDYEWAHPTTKKVEDKTAFIQRVAGTELLVGVGFYR